MGALVASVFVASLLGSVHCAAMCGSFACLATGGGAGDGRGVTASAVWYNAGRLLAYVTLGALAGAAGAGLNAIGSVAGAARPAAVTAGVLLMLWGTASLLAAAGVRVPSLRVPPSLSAGLSRGVRAVRSRPPVVRGLAVGVLTAALPCGWLYAFVATASSAGSAAGGALVMSVFWLGTLPMMMTVALGAQRLLGPARRRLPAVTAALLVLLGALTAAGRFGGASIAKHDAHAAVAPVSHGTSADVHQHR